VIRLDSILPRVSPQEAASQEARDGALLWMDHLGRIIFVLAIILALIAPSRRNKK
jgi:hypothetical protein